MKNKIIKKVKLKSLQFKMLFILIIAYIISFFLKEKEKYKNLWIISERGYDARDNAYHLFKYIKKNHPEINIYYIIDKNSADRTKVENLGDIIFYRSFKHYLYLCLAEKCISTHLMGYSPEQFVFPSFDRIFNFRFKRIFLQHGIIKDDLKGLYSDKVTLDLFVCGAKPEYDDIKNHYGHRDGVVQYLGLCRYDNLDCNNVKNQILVMPTWRRELNNLKADEFKKTEYFNRYNQLLSNQKLKDVLEEYNCQLLFYPHYEFQKYLSCFSESKNIKLADFSHYDVQQLLKESALLVTDYSSIFFDFAYMKKPLFYYQFDADEFYATHYSKGYFSFEEMGFGKVVANGDELVDGIISSIKNGFKQEPLYEERTKKFFVLSDKNNCKRNFEAIEKL